MKNTISFNTKFGWISATETNNKITKIHFRKDISRGKLSKNLRFLKNNFIDSFNCKSNSFKIPIEMNGNKTQKKIWNELKKITKGKTKTYGEIGKKLKISPRYIGRVCGENKHILVIPCHRVVRTNGSLGGFSARGGVNLKRKLLIFENRKFK